MKLLLKEVRLDGQEVQTFDLFCYQDNKGFTDTPTILARHVGTLSSLPVEVIA